MLFLLFQIGKDRYALEASRVVEVVPLLALKELPQAPKGVAGLFNYRGALVPAVDLSELARRHQKDMPYLIQYFLQSLGRDAVSCADLMSYLLFTREYTRALLDIGYNDASERIDEIEEFIYGSDTTHSSTSRKVFTAAAIRGNRPLPSAATPRAYPPAAPRP